MIFHGFRPFFISDYDFLSQLIIPSRSLVFFARFFGCVEGLVVFRFVLVLVLALALPFSFEDLRFAAVGLAFAVMARAASPAAQQQQRMASLAVH